MGRKKSTKIQNWESDKKTQDLLERMQIEEIARLFSQAPLSVMIINCDGIITFVNDYFKVLSASRTPLNRNISRLPFFKKENLCHDYDKLFKTGAVVNRQLCQTKNLEGKTKYINIHAVPLYSPDGRIFGALSMATDTTDAVVAKHKLQLLNLRLEKKVSDRTKQLSEINRRLRKSLELKQQFISDASHELRTPLTIMRLNMELAEREYRERRERTPQIFRTLNNEIEKVADIIYDLSFLASIDSGQIQITAEDVSLIRLMDSLIERLAPLAEEKNIKIDWKKCRRDIFIRGDRIKLEKLFLNIIRNAIKYGNKNGWIKITAQNSSGGKVLVAFSDNGIGIPEDEIPYIFHRFYRSSLSQKTGAGGFGLGLTICKWIADRHNGKIFVKSKVGRGSIFTVSLPVLSV